MPVPPHGGCVSVEAARWIVAAVAAYAGIGLVFALAFVAVGAAHIDPAARGMPWSVRLLLLPGAAALWPLLCIKWWTRQPPPVA